MFNATGPVAVIAAHPDDEILGCGGTIARLASVGREVHILLLADGETSRSDSDTQYRFLAAQEAANITGCASVKMLNLPDNRLDGFELLHVVKLVENFLDKIKPSIVLTHYVGDLNVDHQITHKATVTACRAYPGQYVKELLFFEVPSSTEWMFAGQGQTFSPNFFVNISDTIETKLQALRAYERELRPSPHPRSLQAIQALARWRGASVGLDAAEGFMLGRFIL